MISWLRTKKSQDAGPASILHDPNRFAASIGRISNRPADTCSLCRRPPVLSVRVAVLLPESEPQGKFHVNWLIIFRACDIRFRAVRSSIEVMKASNGLYRLRWF